MKHSKDSRDQVEKIWLNNDIAKNWTRQPEKKGDEMMNDEI